MTGVITCTVGYSGASYSKATGFTAFMGFPSAIDPQIQLSAPMELELNFDSHTWKMTLPDQTTIAYLPPSGHHVIASVVDGQWQGITGLGTNDIAPTAEKSGFFDIMVAE